jgi:hypothetical protein
VDGVDLVDAVDWVDWVDRQRRKLCEAPPNLPPFQGGRLFYWYLGLKPQAGFLSPFGTKIRQEIVQYSSAQQLRVAGFEDEDDDEYENEIFAHAFWRRMVSRGLVASAVWLSWPRPTS